MLFTNRAYTKHQDIHDQESFRKTGFLYSALQSLIQYCVVTASDIEISSLLNGNPLKNSKKIKDFLCNMFEFINLLWSLIFIKSNRCNKLFLKFNKIDKIEQFEERSTSHAHANIIFG